MSEHGSVNSQIVDSVTDVVTLTNALAPANAFGMLDAVMTETLGMSMYNAVSRQQGGSMIGSAAATAVCAKMLSTPFPFEIPPAPVPPKPAGGGVNDLKPVPPPPSPPPPSQAVVIATAFAEAEEAITILKQAAHGEEAAIASADLDVLAAMVDPPASPPGPPSPPQ
jgi:hypothetical protein